MAQQAQQQGGSDNSMAPVWIMVLLFITAYLIWVTGHLYIVKIVFQLNIWQAQLINLFIHNEELTNLISIMQTVDINAVGWNELVDITRLVGNFTRYPIVAIILILAFILYQTDIKLKFRKVYDMNRLRQQEQFNWPAIMPVCKEDLVSQDVNKGPWAMAMTPLEFARRYNLLKKEDVLLDNPIPGQEMTAGIRRGDAKRVFTLQLGPYWDGFEHCSPQAYALAGAFIARINRDRDAANNILVTIDRTFVSGKPDFFVARSTIEKYKNTEIVQEITTKHAYTLTVMASLLEKARDDGVVPSSEFLWLKPLDRRLWYMLNCVGRQTPYAEVGGPFAHWKAEKKMDRRSLLPLVDEAIKALEIAIKEVKLTPSQLQELEP